MFVSDQDGELTQVDIWNLYREAFSPYQEKHPLLVAADVIKNVNLVFPKALAMVLNATATTPQKFVVRGIDRRKSSVSWKCLWDHSQCSAAAFASPGQLYDHLLEHLSNMDSSQSPCLWSSCSQTQFTKSTLRAHVLTHLSTQPSQQHPSQSDTITLPSSDSPYPIENPTSRPPPPLRSAMISFKMPTVDPPSSSLTALLCIRILFRASFASADVAPRADADHFGFPGIVEEAEDQEGMDSRDGGTLDREQEGERRGRKAFVGIRKLLEEVRIRDEPLQGWITEMIDAGISGAH